MPEMIVQWVTETFGQVFKDGDMEWGYDRQCIKIGPIAGRFKCLELANSDCLRFVDPECGCFFNERQVETIEDEVVLLLNLELTNEERIDCEALQKYIGLLTPEKRSLMYLRFCSKEYSKYYDAGEFLMRR